MKMREIKFRAWNISGEKWVYFTFKELALMGVYNHPYGMAPICRWKNYKWWSQFTGRKDKNGVEIYGSKGDMRGGDRVRSDGGGKYAVVWSTTFSAWAIEDAKGCYCGSLWKSELFEILPPQDKEGK